METQRLLILLLIMCLLVAGCVAIAEQPTDDPSLEDFMTSTTTLPPTETPTPAPPTETPTPTPLPLETYTGVIIGTDWDPNRPERVRFGVRSDTFIIYSFVVDPNRDIIWDADLIALPRDLWVPVPCSPLDPELEGYDRINAAYAYGEYDCVKETLEELGFEVNAPIFKVEMRGFISLVNRMGGIRITPRETYSDKCGHFQGTEGSGYGWRTWTEGVEYWMDGNHALCYARARTNSNDLDRNRRQLEILLAMMDQFPEQIFDSSNRLDAVNELIGVWTWANDYVETDYSLVDTGSFVIKFGGYGIDWVNGDVPFLIHRMPLETVEFWTTPIYGASVLRPRVDVAAWIRCEMDNHEGLTDCLVETLLEAVEES